MESSAREINASDMEDSSHGSGRVWGVGASRISYGLCVYAMKEEDTHTVQPPHLFGVFDGHGGDAIARACADHNWTDESAHLEDIFWQLDEHLGPKHITCGSTASVMKLEKTLEQGYAVTLAWVGDSQIMELDMLASEPRVTFLSSAHNVDNDEEMARIREFWAIRSKFKEGDGGGDAKKGDGDGDHDIPDDIPSLARHAFRYNKSVDRAYIDKLRPRLERMNSEFSRRRNSADKPVGPTALMTHWRNRKDSKPVLGPSTCVTRSIGDYDSSRALIPHPEIVRRVVRPGDVRRYIIASDGLWEVLDMNEVARTAFKTHRSNPQKTAESLLKRVRQQCAKRNGVYEHPFKDDTTIIIVDIVLQEDSIPIAVKKRSSCLLCN